MLTGASTSFPLGYAQGEPRLGRRHRFLDDATPVIGQPPVLLHGGVALVAAIAGFDAETGVVAFVHQPEVALLKQRSTLPRVPLPQSSRATGDTVRETAKQRVNGFEDDVPVVGILHSPDPRLMEVRDTFGRPFGRPFIKDKNRGRCMPAPV